MLVCAFIICSASVTHIIICSSYVTHIIIKLMEPSSQASTIRLYEARLNREQRCYLKEVCESVIDLSVTHAHKYTSIHRSIHL